MGVGVKQPEGELKREGKLPSFWKPGSVSLAWDPSGLPDGVFWLMRVHTPLFGVLPCSRESLAPMPDSFPRPHLGWHIL